jgi:hypothetical protein
MSMVRTWILSAIATPSVQVKVRAIIKPNRTSEILSIGSRIRSGNLADVIGSTNISTASQLALPICVPGFSTSLGSFVHSPDSHGGESTNESKYQIWSTRNLLWRKKRPQCTIGQVSSIRSAHRAWQLISVVTGDRLRHHNCEGLRCGLAAAGDVRGAGAPAGAAQADFGEVIGVIGGVERKLHFFAFDARFSYIAEIRADIKFHRHFLS